MNDLQSFYGPNAAYVLELYERYLQDPESVDAATRATFASWTSMSQNTDTSPASAPTAAKPAPIASKARPESQPSRQTGELPAVRASGASAPASPQISQVVAASILAHSIRERGHLGAHLDPLGSKPLGDPALLPETHGISKDDLAKLPPEVVGGHAGEFASNALEAINLLRAMYSGTISYEFDQVKTPGERKWLRDAVGLSLYHKKVSPAIRKQLLQRLTEVEAFEQYLHKTFVAQKRFSLEGLDMLVPMLDLVISEAVETESREVVIGMAHRGRLNVLAHVLQKPYAAIFSEFIHAPHDEAHPTYFEHGYTGDVKYHLGAEQILGEGAAVDLKINLAPNPSHLEFVNPVIEGFARASQEVNDVPGVPLQDVDLALPIAIHGDAAFPGEGVVSETLNLWHLRGYWVGGTIHIIANNQLGFTTDPSDSRSTHFASDLAKGFEIPIIHVNADDPDACRVAMRIAHAYRDRFHKDILIDLVGYRRWGHNESDVPEFTQPQMYEKVTKHPTVRALYAQKLEQEGIVTKDEAEEMVKQAFAVLEQARKDAVSGAFAQAIDPSINDGEETQEVQFPAQVKSQQLLTFNKELLAWPEGFSPNNKLARLLQRRGTAMGADGGIDWGHAEALAFASILVDGTPIRLTGQDTERGTFSHRHAVLHDQHHGEVYVPLQHLRQAKASFSIFNSPLSETAALGFEYGYSVYSNESLVLWEAQFGDFANVAQVIIDQFLASGRAKWRQDSSLVMLLPHGYEGQGPEHSSARLERYLQLAAEDNWQVANCSTAAQYYHLLRLQAANLKHHPRPLIIMTPKSLLRNQSSAAKLSELVEGKFQRVIDDPLAQERAEGIRRVVLCTGKIAIDLLSHSSRAKAEDVAIVRVEMLYPFPEQELKEVLARYPNARDIVWVQEEPANMGAWSYMSSHITDLAPSRVEVNVVARPDRSSPAEGFIELHQAEQEQIIASALRSSIKEFGGKHVR
ncbi:MAG TPA: 2-oxoglutarate dehydrogenase E1 component [Ktedonobacteraceae bacterium]|nr:2-oxoglutarate dehydrogenase E1 component [Ktedonobacteraceae bacterium]